MLISMKNSVCSHKDEHHFELKSFTKQFTCDGCKQQGSGPRYRCDNCGYELHKECMCPEATTSHEFCENSLFQFHIVPQIQCGDIYCEKHGRICDACGKDILGFNYQSVDKRWDLHPRCTKLEKKLPIEDTLFELHRKVSSRCIWCKEKKIPGWSYVSSCGDYHFHVHCLMEMVHSKASTMGGNLAIQKIELRQLAKSKKKDKKGSGFLSIVKLFVKTILSILLGDPTTLLAGALVELISNG